MTIYVHYSGACKFICAYNYDRRFENSQILPNLVTIQCTATKILYGQDIVRPWPYITLNEQQTHSRTIFLWLYITLAVQYFCGRTLYGYVRPWPYILAV